MNKIFTKLTTIIALAMMCNATANAQTKRIPCNGLAFQVAKQPALNGFPADPTQDLYAINLRTGSITKLGDMPFEVNAIGYDETSGLIWGSGISGENGTAGTYGNVVRIDATGIQTHYEIPHLPKPQTEDYYIASTGLVGPNSTDNRYSCGTIHNGYLYLTGYGTATYYVVDIDSTRTSTYLQLVESSSLTTIDVAPYGTNFSGDALAVDLTDWAWDINSGNIVGIVGWVKGAWNGTPRADSLTAGHIFYLNPASGGVTLSASEATGYDVANSPTERYQTGSMFMDVHSYTAIYSNDLGDFYNVDITNSPNYPFTYLLTSYSPVNNAPFRRNDGATCLSASIAQNISGNVFEDINNNTVIDGESGFTAGTDLYVYLIDENGHIEDSSKVASDGTYTLFGRTGDFTIKLSTQQYPIFVGAKSAPAAVIDVTAPAGYTTVGENNSGNNTGFGDGTPDGSMSVTVGTTDVIQQNFGLILTSLLPLNWLSIKATLNNQKQVQLNWKVSENDVMKYEIEKSDDGRSFKSIGNVVSKGNGTNTYIFTDAKTLSGIAYYRIKQTEIDGNRSYSTIISLSNNTNEITSIYPNPATDLITVSVDKGMLNSTATIIDMMGRNLQTVKINSQSFIINISDYPTGVYVLKMENGEAIKIEKQ